MNILFLDDNQTRHDKFVEVNPEATIYPVYTVAQALEALREHSPFDCVCLDHDLGGQVYVESGDNTGFEVARYITQELSKDQLPSKIIIHSWNPVGALNMKRELQSLGISMICIPFPSDGLKV